MFFSVTVFVPKSSSEPHRGDLITTDLFGYLDILKTIVSEQRNARTFDQTGRSRWLLTIDLFGDSHIKIITNLN